MGEASIEVSLSDGDTTFYGDERKIRGFVGELVENSIKHNAGNENLSIRISSKVSDALPSDMGHNFFKKYRVAGEHKWLQIII